MDQGAKPLMGITPMMEWIRDHYKKTYAPNSRETVRRQTMPVCRRGYRSLQSRQTRTAREQSGHCVPDRAVCPNLAAQFRHEGMERQSDGIPCEASNTRRTLRARAQANLIPVQIAPGNEVNLSPGEHSELIKAIIEDFGARFVPGGVLVYAGDTGDKWGYFDAVLLSKLGVSVDAHGKMPDVVLYYSERNWLLLIESVTSHGLVDGKRHAELSRLFANTTAGLVYVTAFPNRAIMSRFLGEIAWETEVWVADAPSHLIHFNGEHFLGPHAPPHQLRLD
jgi:BsuBI/PstI restriction endonuclease domain/BsuBI/PstI restriction endonuclease HTH domain